MIEFGFPYRGSSMRNNKVKRMTVSIICLSFLLVVFSFAAVAFLNGSFSWFSFSTNSRVREIELSIEGDKYDIYVDNRTDEFEREELNEESVMEPVYPHVNLLKDLLDDKYSFTDNSTSGSKSLALELKATEPFEGRYSLMPGSYGDFYFYIKLHEGITELDITFDFSIAALNYNSTIADLEEVTSTNILNLLKGHFLFFTEREEVNGSYQYGGLITDETIEYDTSQHTSDIVTIEGEDYYKVSIYWEWPLDYYEIYEKTGEKYPVEITSYVSENHNYFFATNQGSSDIELLSDGYNDGDQLIGEGVDFLLLQIIAN